MDILSENRKNSEQKIALEKVIHEILGDQYGDSASLRGWLFSVLVDSQFIDGGLNKNFIRKRSGRWSICSERADIAQAATDHLERINQLGDVTEQFAALDNLIR